MTDVARADEGGGPAWLDYSRGDGADGCPGPAEFAAMLEARLTAPAASMLTDAGRRLSAHLERGKRGDGMPPTWLGEVRMAEANGELVGVRTITKRGETCAPVADALALVAALTMSNAPTVPAAEDDAPETAPAPAAAPPPVLVGRPPTWHATVELGGAAGWGMLPGLAWGGHARTSFEPPAWPRWFVEGSYWPATRTTTAAAEGARVSFARAGFGLCPLAGETSRLRAGLCLGGGVGRTRAEAFGFASSTGQTLWAVDVAANAQVALRLSTRLHVGLGVDGLLPLSRNRLAYTASDGSTPRLWSAWPVLVSTHLCLGYTFH